MEGILDSDDICLKVNCDIKIVLGGNMLKILEKELDKFNQIEYEIEKTIKEAPEGSFRCSENRGYFQYYQGKRYLNKKKKQYVAMIAQKDYCIKMREIVRKIKQNIFELMKLYAEINHVYYNLTPGRKVLVKPLIVPTEDIIKEFEEIKYEGKDFEEQDMTEYYTIKGERVRSKSEIIIANELYRNGIPYKYEIPIELESWNRKITIYPDFTALNKRTGKRIIIEHFGMMDNIDYYESAMQKLDTYEKNEIILGDRLLIFHETATVPLNIKVIQKYIEKYLM